MLHDGNRDGKPPGPEPGGGCTAEAPHSRNGQRRIVATYDYADEAGQLLYQAVRYEPKDFRQRRPDGRSGWTWSLGDVRRVLYRLPELLAADPDRPVFVVEGEKDADALHALGLVATTGAMGAGKWRPEYGEALRGRHVIVLPDNDEAGRKHAAQVAEALKGVAASARVVELPGLPPKGDVSDWLQADGNDKVRLLELAGKVAACGMAEKDRGPDDNADFLTDLGNARRFARKYRADVRHCHPWSKDFVWDGRRWREDDTGEVERKAKALVIEMFREAIEDGDEDRRKRLLAHAMRSQDARRIGAMHRLANSEDGIPVLPPELDRDPYLLNLPNGVIDLRTGELRPHERADLITKLCPTDYRPEAKCPVWERTLAAIFPATGDAAEQPGDVELIGFVQRFFGYCLTGDVREHVLLIGWGVGANGKTTIVNTVMDVMGPDYAMKANPELLMVRRGERHPTELADLHGRRLMVASETAEGARLNEALVKDLTGGERIRARRMKEDFWEFTATHKVLLLTNHKPRVRGTDKGIWRRLALVPFAVTFWNGDDPTDVAKGLPERLRQDKQLTEKLRGEREGILAWLVRGCLDWQQGGLKVPASVSQATKEYRDAEDLTAQFLAECCLTAPNVRARASALYDRYSRWCEGAGEKVSSQRVFGTCLTERGFERQLSNGTWYIGLCLRDNTNTEGPDTERWSSGP